MRGYKAAKMHTALFSQGFIVHMVVAQKMVQKNSDLKHAIKYNAAWFPLRHYQGVYATWPY